MAKTKSSKTKEPTKPLKKASSEANKKLMLKRSINAPRTISSDRPGSRTVRIWTRAYNPWRLGGDLYQPMATKVKGHGPHELGGGYTGFLIKAPNKSTLVAETTTGAVVGNTLEQVREDIATADVKVMRQQMTEAVTRGASAQEVTPNKFWEAIKRSN